ncbi:MAG TPA: type II toxin-antitoxin system VapB family antitoxin [Jatrophihabitantaceae bacterium]|nr:type II toxin-antitoxin system VapB family antitoxin [Jatrophihabitantaceae bacterium]
MSRTNIDIDDALIAEIMATYGLRTKREAVDFALRRARRPKPLEPDEIIALFGTGFIDPDFDLDEIRTTRTFDDAAIAGQSA